MPDRRDIHETGSDRPGRGWNIMKKVSRNNLSDQIFEYISRRIIRNELGPGEEVFETQISKDLGVSRSPVRDALHRLEQIRLVDRTPRGNYEVTRLSEPFVENFYDTVNIIYRYTASKSAQFAGKKDIDSFDRAITIVAQGVIKRDFNLYLEGVTLFGHVLLKTAGNPIVERIAIDLMPSAERIQWMAITFLPGRMVELGDLIRKGYEGIAEHDSNKAAQAFTDFAAIQRLIAIQSLIESHKDTLPCTSP